MVVWCCDLFGYVGIVARFELLWHKVQLLLFSHLTRVTIIITIHLIAHLSSDVLLHALLMRLVLLHPEANLQYQYNRRTIHECRHVEAAGGRQQQAAVGSVGGRSDGRMHGWWWVVGGGGW